MDSCLIENNYSESIESKKPLIKSLSIDNGFSPGKTYRICVVSANKDIALQSYKHATQEVFTLAKHSIYVKTETSVGRIITSPNKKLEIVLEGVTDP